MKHTAKLNSLLSLAFLLSSCNYSSVNNTTTLYLPGGVIFDSSTCYIYYKSCCYDNKNISQSFTMTIKEAKKITGFNKATIKIPRTETQKEEVQIFPSKIIINGTNTNGEQPYHYSTSDVNIDLTYDVSEISISSFTYLISEIEFDEGLSIQTIINLQ
jgi:hypothetical protein